MAKAHWEVKEFKVLPEVVRVCKAHRGLKELALKGFKVLRVLKVHRDLKEPALKGFKVRRVPIHLVVRSGSLLDL